jgi:Spy/CpxP family protein refolding chaperone
MLDKTEENPMKKLSSIALIATLMAVSTAPVMADGHGPKGKYEQSEKRIEKMAKKLELTEQQKEAVTKVMADTKAANDALDKRYKMDEYRSERKALRTDSKKKIDAILTPAQQEEMQEMRDKRKKKMPKNGEK